MSRSSRSAATRSPVRADAEAWLVAGVFLALGCIGLLHHEMWRDELEIWLIARDSASPGELLTNLRTEGHPILWYALNFVVSRFTRDPIGMQALSLLIGTLTAWTVARFAPFTRPQRLLFCFGYYLLFEYTMISRSYGLQLLLMVTLCALVGSRRRARVVQAVVLALLANTHLFGSIAAALLGTLLLVREIGPAVRRDEPRARRDAAGFLALLVPGVALGVGHTLLQISRLGPDHLAFTHTWDVAWVVDSLATLFHGYVPLPNVLDEHFWNTTILALAPEALRSWLAAALGLTLIAASARALARRPAVLLVFLAGGAAMLTCTLFFWHGAVRHHGQVFVLFAACYWLVLQDSAPGPRTRLTTDRWFTALLAVHVAAAAFAYTVDLRRPFSNARAVGAYLRDSGLRDAPLAGSIDYAAQSVSAFVDRPIYYSESRRFGTFVDWGPERRHVPPSAVMADAAGLMRERGREVVVILNYELNTPRVGEVVSVGPDVRVEGVARFVGAIVDDENFFLYRVYSDGRSYFPRTEPMVASR